MKDRDKRILAYLKRPMTAGALAALLGVTRLTAYRALQVLVPDGRVFVYSYEITGRRGPRARLYKASR